MPRLIVSERTGPHPIEIIRDAVRAVRAQGIAVVPGDLGVHCTGSAGLVTWERDRDRVVSPMGAVLLHVQPQAADTEKALALALDAPEAWLYGFEAGVSRTPPADAWAALPNARLFLAAYKQGIEYRGELFGRPQLGSVPGGRAN